MCYDFSIQKKTKYTIAMNTTGKARSAWLIYLCLLLAAGALGGIYTRPPSEPMNSGEALAVTAGLVVSFWFARKRFVAHWLGLGRGKFASHLGGLAIGFAGAFGFMVAYVSVGIPVSVNAERPAVAASSGADDLADPPAPTASEPATGFSAEWIKTLSPEVLSVSLTEQITRPGTYLVELDLATAVLWGGAQDWNSVAALVHHVGKALFSRPEPVRIHFAFRSVDNNIDWARVFVEHDRLPQNWPHLTYLEFFGFARTAPGTLQANGWLCEFFKKYESARPRLDKSPRC